LSRGAKIATSAAVRSANAATRPKHRRHADGRGNRQAEDHPPDRLGALVGPHERGGQQHGNAEIGAVRQAGQEAEQQHRGIIGREARQAVGQGEHRHQQNQQRPPRHARRQHRDQRRAHHHAQRIGADDMARRRRVDAEIARKIRQQAHCREFGDTDGETAHRQRQVNDAGMKYPPIDAVGVHLSRPKISM
jgi:hypothetical protein